MVIKTLVICVLCVLSSAAIGNAASFDLTDSNSTVKIDSGSLGVHDWLIDGTNHMNKAGWWYRIGTGAEQSINTLTLSSSAPVGNNRLTLNYTNATLNFDLQIKYTLTGGEYPGCADISEALMVTNNNATDLDFHLFKFADFNLNGTPNNDYGELLEDNTTIRQTDPLIEGEYQTLVDVAVNSTSAHVLTREITDAPQTLLNSLNDGGTSALTNQTSPLSGDIAFAFQWDFTLTSTGSDETKSITSSTQIWDGQTTSESEVPEGNALALAGMGLCSLIGLRRRR